ncbi:MAG: hypothetical protein EOL87_01965 [Spartobacteria bacterium]|nr:hypothetical protein [Spartobacteria bacterium]
MSNLRKRIEKLEKELEKIDSKQADLNETAIKDANETLIMVSQEERKKELMMELASLKAELINE